MILQIHVSLRVYDPDVDVDVIVPLRSWRDRWLAMVLLFLQSLNKTYNERLHASYSLACDIHVCFASATSSTAQR